MPPRGTRRSRTSCRRATRRATAGGASGSRTRGRWSEPFFVHAPLGWGQILFFLQIPPAFVTTCNPTILGKNRQPKHTVSQALTERMHRHTHWHVRNLRLLIVVTAAGSCAPRGIPTGPGPATFNLAFNHEGATAIHSSKSFWRARTLRRGAMFDFNREINGAQVKNRSVRDPEKRDASETKISITSQ